MFRKLILASGLAGAAYSLYKNSTKESKTKLAELIRNVFSKFKFQNLLSLIKK